MKSITLNNLLILSLVFSPSLVSSIQCSKDAVLKRYQINEFASLGEIESDTPPSKTTEKWWINPCEENNEANVNIPSDCYHDDVSCGLVEVLLPGKEALTTQVINFSKNLKYVAEEFDDKLLITLKGTKWGSNTFDAEFEFSCDPKLKSDTLVETSWQRGLIKLYVNGPSGCLRDKRDNDNDDNNNNKDKDDDNNRKDSDKKNGNSEKNKRNGGISWFSWLLIYSLMFTLIYLMVVSYMNTRGGSFDDFRTEFVTRSTQLLTSLPEFTKEVINKVLGRNDSQRGGYSAV
ncbi:Atg27p NDAI_0B00330 [Naumovozyma dairenensis CBS 421]|uniref:Autophagy-related protein 27 n=1 Tax=Naumovozyma dairenensis (strain ATCC 10597 / BCRC 20456 / CBS 421 / NBRC 0211 / NRRL Y-12639) TaxID=1071378 RepID=G0W5K6_NAUDC|nr:hypothetical protein NDAI_0B00330 [Naumovozyma dairenensis CBS 421]CCD23067.1 hypothetical protein NDAI_0B00330 [Naumovozyma dairenensis CBS 421]